MTDIAFGQAFGAGFRIIARKPGAVGVWAAAYLLLGLAPIVLAIAAILPDWLAMIRAAQSQSEPQMSDIFRMQSKMMMLQGVGFLTGTVVRALLAGAVFRAVLEPENDRNFYLRLGMQELWVGVVMLVMGFLLGAAVFATMLPIGIVTAIVAAAAAASNGGAAVIVPIILVAVLVETALITWLAVRFSLAAPMSFAEREFRLFESWSLTRGHGWTLLGLALALMAVIAAIVLPIELIGLGAAFVAFGDQLAHGGKPAFLSRPPAEWLGAAIPWVILGVVVLSLVSAAVNAIFLGPWAEVYRQLKTEGEPGVA